MEEPYHDRYLCQNGDVALEGSDDLDPSSAERESKRRRLGTSSSHSPLTPPHHHIDLPSDESLSSPTTTTTSWFQFSADPDASFDDIHLIKDEYLRPPPGIDFPPPTPPNEYSSPNSSQSSLSDYSYSMDEDSSQTPSESSSPTNSFASITPALIRMASINLTHDGHNYDDYQGLFRAELQDRSASCTSEDFLKIVLGYSSDDWQMVVDALGNDPDLQATYHDHAQRYFSAPEVDRYKIFSALREIVLGKATSNSARPAAHVAPTCQWQDTHDVVIHGSPAARKPDYCAVPVGWDKSQVPFWDDVIFWEEFKKAPKSKRYGDGEKNEKGEGASKPSRGVGSGRGRSSSRNRGSRAGGSGKGTGSSGRGKVEIRSSADVGVSGEGTTENASASSSRKRSASQRQSGGSAPLSSKAKRKDIHFTVDMLQAAGYALECLNSSCLRLWSAGSFINNGVVQMMYLDRGGAVVAEKFRVLTMVEGDEIECFQNFIVLSLAFSFCRPSQQGFDTEWTRTTISTPPEPGDGRAKLPDVRGWKRVIEDLEFEAVEQLERWQGYGFVTQAPRVIKGKGIRKHSETEESPSDGATEPDHTPESQDDSIGEYQRGQSGDLGDRSTESQGMGEGQTGSEGGQTSADKEDVKGKNWKDLQLQDLVVKASWGLVSRETEAEMILSAQESGVKGLPEILAKSKGKRLSELPRAQLINNFDYNDDREVSYMVMPRYEPLEQQEEGKFVTAFGQIMETHRDLYKKANILHRDISIQNLCIDPNHQRREDGRLGILLDFNHAIRTDREYTHHPQFRTGTLPFMAIDLLEENAPPHRYKHDLESFFWVLVWVVAFENDRRRGLQWGEAKLSLHNLSFLFHGKTMREVAAEKCLFLLDPQKYTKQLKEARNNPRKVIWRWVTFLWSLLGDRLYREKGKDRSQSKRIIRDEASQAPEREFTIVEYGDFEAVFQGQDPGAL